MDTNPVIDNTYWCYSKDETNKAVVDTCLKPLGWSPASSQDEAKLLWGNGSGLKPNESYSDEQILDCTPESNVLTNKYLLCQLLKHNGLEHFQAVSFIIGDLEDEARAIEAIKSEPDRVWIYKHGNIDQGMGIIIFNDPEKLLGHIARHRELTNKYKGLYGNVRNGVLQHYVVNPLLLDDRKSEIRVYWLVLPSDPPQIYYALGTVRLAYKKFELDDWNDKLIHINNVVSIKQELDAKNQPFSPIKLKWSVEELDQYLYSQGKYPTPFYSKQKLEPKIEAILLSSVLAAQEFMRTDKKCFQFFGADFMVSDDLQDIWLTEYQNYPGLDMDDEKKIQALAPMLRDTFKIVTNKYCSESLQPQEVKLDKFIKIVGQ